MSVSLIAVPAFTLVAVILGSGMDPVPTEAPARARPAPRRSPFEAQAVAEPADPVERAYLRAARFKAEAKFLGPTETGLHYLGMCDSILEHTVAMKADHYGAHLLWGDSLFLQAEFSTESETRLKLIEAGSDKFRQAEKCPGVNWRLYDSWGQGLALLAYGRVTDPDARLRFMRQAVEILERGADRKELAEDRGQLLRSAGLAATLLAEKLEDRSARAHWYRQAVRKYDEAHRTGTKITPFHDAVWIEALFNLSDLAEDPEPARQAVERSKKLLELDPDFLTTHYNLACAYAVLGQHHLAIESLETCVAGDAKYLSRIQEDPILKGLRASGEYAAFLESNPGSK